MKQPEHQRIKKKFGQPYEDDGNCELCNFSGAVWMTEDPITWDQTPMCAKCISGALDAGELIKHP